MYVKAALNYLKPVFLPLTNASLQSRSKKKISTVPEIFTTKTGTYFLVMKPRNHVGRRPFWTISGTWVSTNHFLVSSLILSLVPSTWESTSGSRSSILSWFLKSRKPQIHWRWQAECEDQSFVKLFMSDHEPESWLAWSSGCCTFYIQTNIYLVFSNPFANML